MSDMQDLLDRGEVQTVADILGDTGEVIAPPCVPPILPGLPGFPAPGIYFDMDEDIYHAIHACSTSGLKKLAASSMDYWCDSAISTDKPAPSEKDSLFLLLGKAYHKRIIEGRAAYTACYAVELSKADYANALVTTDQIKARIAELGQKPCSKGYDDVTRTAKKEDWIAQLLDLDPDAIIWDNIVANFAREHAGMTFISAQDHRRIEIAAHMIEAHPELKDAFKGGWPEVSIFYYCPTTGAPMKMRMDYLKMRAIVDLKSFSNPRGLPVNRAIESAIANMRYNLQHVIYDEAATAVREIIREHGASAIFTHPFAPVERREAQRDWTLKWAQQAERPTFMFVFQKTGRAPVSRGKIMPRGTVFSVTRSRAQALKRKWVECANTFGVDPWLDIEAIDTIEDEAIPLYATEL